MSVLNDMESVEKEVRELILHSKSKRCTTFEPCSEENLPKYLKSIEEELTVLGISYRFNQYEDLDPPKRMEALVRLANGVWGLLLHHKDVAANGSQLKDRNYSLQQNNFFLNDMVDKQKKEMERSKSRMKQVAEDTRQMVLKLEAGHREVARAQGEARRSKGQLASREHELLIQLRRAERDHATLKDRFLGANGIYISKNESRDQLAEEARLKEKKYKETIAKLQENNRQLIQEVINLKEDLMEDVGNVDT